ncbi:MAG: helical backbone metal receptor [bacterium]|nr:helical backbone metal receptor [bacterium]
MSKFFSVLILPILLFASPLGATERIISLKPNITEILYALGAEDQLVGVTTFCTRPPAAGKLPKVADYIRANPEKILKLKPDLILASRENGSQKEIYFLMDRGISVELLSFGNFEEIKSSVSKLGRLLKKEAQAEQILKKMQEAIEQLKSQAKNSPKRKTLWVVGYEPLVVVGGNNFIDDAGKLLNLENVAGKSSLKYPTYSTEQMIRTAPEVIIDLAMGTESSPEKRKEHMAWWQRFPSIPAVQNNKIIPFSMYEFRPVPQLPETLKELAKKIR